MAKGKGSQATRRVRAFRDKPSRPG